MNRSHHTHNTPSRSRADASARRQARAAVSQPEYHAQMSEESTVRSTSRRRAQERLRSREQARAVRRAEHQHARSVGAQPELRTSEQAKRQVTAVGARRAPGAAGRDTTVAGANPSEGMQERNFKIKPQRPKRTKLKFALISLLLFFTCIGVAGAWYYFDVSGNLHRGLDGDLSGVLVKTDLNKEPFYMLLLGTDRSKERDADPASGEAYRSDSMMLVRVDPIDKKVTLVSLHRDTLMDMGKNGHQKLNAAYTIGGPSYTVQTVSKLAGVPISHYAEINFDGFKDVVNALGGITVDVPMEINDADAGGHLDKGVQELNGDQALILCRARHAYDEYGDGDLYRAANQRLVMQAIAKKILSADPGTMANTIKALSRYITTDLEITDIIGLAQHMRGIDLSKNLYSGMEPTISKYIDGDGWYEYCNEKAWKTMMSRVDQGLPPVERDQIDASGTVMAQAGSGEASQKESGDSLGKHSRGGTVIVQNGTGVEGLAAQVAQKLEPQGYKVSPENADDFDTESTVVIYKRNDQYNEARDLASELGVSNITRNNGGYQFNGDFLVILGSDYRS